MQLLLRINVMLYFICMRFAKLWGTGSKIKIQNENICTQLDSNPQHFAPRAGALDHSATLTDDKLCLRVLYNHVI